MSSWMNLTIQMQTDPTLALFHCQSQKRLYGLTPCQVEVLGVQGLEFLLELLTRSCRCRGQVGHEYHNYDEFLSFLSHQDCVLFVDRKVLMLRVLLPVP